MSANVQIRPNILNAKPHQRFQFRCGSKTAVIHFNWGLHDLKYVDNEGKLTSKENGKQFATIKEYQENLETLVTRLKKTGAKLIWTTTTPVPEGSNGRIKGDAAKYNAAAKAVMDKHKIAINDLYAFALPQLTEIQRPKNVHFTNEGYEALAKQVANVIQKVLEK